MGSSDFTIMHSLVMNEKKKKKKAIFDDLSFK